MNVVNIAGRSREFDPPERRITALSITHTGQVRIPNQQGQRGVARRSCVSPGCRTPPAFRVRTQEERVTHLLEIAAAALLLIVPADATSQDLTHVRVVRAAAVLSQPEGSADALGTVSPGDVLEVLDGRDGWYLVRPPTGSAQTWRTGWVNAGSVVPISGPAPARGPEAAARAPGNRKGFIFGLGGGAGLHRAPVFPGFAASGTTNDFAVITDLSIGYAPTDQLLIFYNNQVAWSRNVQTDVVGVTGVGMTYLFKPSSPSPFVRAAVGGGIVADVDFDSGSVSDNDSGLGMSVGGGFEFARHWTIEGGAMFVRVAEGSNHTVLKVAFSWLFY